MNKYLVCCICCSVFLPFKNDACGQWKQFGMPGVRTVTSLATHGDALIVGTDWGVFSSANRGAEWAPANSGMFPQNNVTGVTSVTLNNGRVFAVTTDSGIVFRSSNDGISWTRSEGGLPRGTSAICIVNDKIFAGGQYGGLYVSVDSGAEWLAVVDTSEISHSIVVAFTITNHAIYVLTQNRGVYSSIDQGLHWTAMNNGLNTAFLDQIWMISSNSDTVAVATYMHGVFVLTDGSSNWTSGAGSGLPTSGWIPYALALKGRNLFLGTDKGLFHSTNSGASWTRSDAGINSTVDAFRYFGDTLFVGTGPGPSFSTNSPHTYGVGIFYSTNEGTDWISCNSGLINLPVLAMAFADSNLIVGLESEGRGNFEREYFTSDQGARWIAGKLANADLYVFASFLEVNSDLYSAGGLGGARHSTDYGENWTTSTNGLGSDNAVVVLAGAGENLYAGTINGVFLSTNKSASWSAKNNGIPSGTYVSALAISNNNIYAGTNSLWLAGGGSGMFRSTNDGVSWSSDNDGLNDSIINCVAVCGTHVLVGTRIGICLSTNNGENWEVASTGPSTGVQVLTVIGTNICAGAGSKVYLSTDSGTTWTDITGGLPTFGIGITSITVSSKDIYLGTDFAGIWRRPIAELISVVEFEKAAPSGQFILSDNYPNPFRETTRILYSHPLSNSGAVNLQIADMLGNDVSRRVRFFRNVDQCSIDIDCANLPAGNYAFTLLSGLQNGHAVLRVVR